MKQTTPNTESQAKELLQKLPDEYMTLSPPEQVLSLDVFRLLALGQPVSRKDLYDTSDLEATDIDRILDGWPGVYYDDEARIIGYWGLALRKMPHRFEVDGRKLFTWCAWDALFIPELLQKTARVVSTCALTGDEIQMTVSPEGITDVGTTGIHVSIPEAPDSEKLVKDVITNFCHLVYFFRSAEAAETWVALHPGTFALPLEEAFELGKGKNTIQYGDVLRVPIQTSSR